MYRVKFTPDYAAVRYSATVLQIEYVAKLTTRARVRTTVISRAGFPSASNGETISGFITRVIIMALNPDEFIQDVRLIVAIPPVVEFFPQISVLDIRILGCFPTFLLPCINPLGHPLERVLYMRSS